MTFYERMKINGLVQALNSAKTVHNLKELLGYLIQTSLDMKEVNDGILSFMTLIIASNHFGCSDFAVTFIDNSDTPVVSFTSTDFLSEKTTRFYVDQDNKKYTFEYAPAGYGDALASYEPNYYKKTGSPSFKRNDKQFVIKNNPDDPNDILGVLYHYKGIRNVATYLESAHNFLCRFDNNGVLRDYRRTYCNNNFGVPENVEMRTFLGPDCYKLNTTVSYKNIRPLDQTLAKVDIIVSHDDEENNQWMRLLIPEGFVPDSMRNIECSTGEIEYRGTIFGADENIFGVVPSIFWLTKERATSIQSDNKLAAEFKNEFPTLFETYNSWNKFGGIRKYIEEQEADNFMEQEQGDKLI